MTRQSKSGGFFPSFGSISKNVKRLAVVAALLYSANISEVKAEEAQYNVKIHKNFMKEVLDKNFPVILKHLENKETKNKSIKEVGADVNGFNLKIVPKSQGAWEEINSDLFFDQGEIVMELSNLQF